MIILTLPIAIINMLGIPKLAGPVFSSQLAAAVTTGMPQSISDQLQKFQKAQAKSAAYLKKFDNLDFDVFTNQKWDRLKESHAKNITVVWPDGHETHGIDRHISDLKAMFVYAPDTRIQVHPVKVASGDWTSVIGVMEGTFTKPMPIGNGKFIQPTGKAFKITMCTVGHWKNGVMDKEYLFWDNQTYMKQIGLGK